MQKKNRFARLVTVGMVVGVLLWSAGCTIVTSHSEESDKDKKAATKKVEINTPFGDLKVRKEVNLKDLGLSPYPNARLLPDEEKSDGDNHGNVSISTPFFGLKVMAAKYESDDPSDKVVDFYKKDLQRYGKVLSCKGPAHGGSRIEKDDDFNLKLNCDDVEGDSKCTTLKAGEGSSQHIVVVEPQDKGTHLSLVYIQMRGKAETM